jgi:hypothetical protein
MNHLNFAQEVNQRMEVLLREQGRLIGYVRRDNETGEEEFFLFESPKEPTSEQERQKRRADLRRGRKFCLVVRAQGQRPLAVVDLADFADLVTGRNGHPGE